MSISSLFFFPSAFLTSLLLGFALATEDLMFCLRGIGFSKLCTDMESPDEEESSNSIAQRFDCFALDSLSCWHLSALAYRLSAFFLLALRASVFMEGATGERTILLLVLLLLAKCWVLSLRKKHLAVSCVQLRLQF
jgi:hypothetical protein